MWGELYQKNSVLEGSEMRMAIGKNSSSAQTRTLVFLYSSRVSSSVCACMLACVHACTCAHTGGD